MIFFSHPSAGDKKIFLEEEFFRYLILSRRHRVGDKISVRNLEDKNLYEYEIQEIGKKKSVLELVGVQYFEPEKKNKTIHLAWGICDLKTITKTLPFLNELDVQKISFIWCDRSQKIKNFQKFIDEKFKKILISSCEQCGRTDLIKIDIVESTEKFLKNFPDTKILDFPNPSFQHFAGSEFSVAIAKEKKYLKSPFLIGPEGGFSPEEKKIFDPEKIFSFKTNLVLRSETAVVKIASMQ